MKTEISSVVVLMIIGLGWTGASAGTAPRQSANLINVNGDPVSAIAPPPSGASSLPPVPAPSGSSSVSPSLAVNSNPSLAPLLSPTSSYKVSYEIMRAWNDGFVATVTIQNTGTTPIQGWTLRWGYAGDQKVDLAWNSSATQSGKMVSVADAGWNKTIPAGGTVSFSFQASCSGNNTNPTIFTLQ